MSKHMVVMLILFSVPSMPGWPCANTGHSQHNTLLTRTKNSTFQKLRTFQSRAKLNALFSSLHCNEILLNVFKRQVTAFRSTFKKNHQNIYVS